MANLALDPAVAGELDQADALLAQGQLAAAARIYRDLFDRQPTLARAAYGLGAVAYKEGHNTFAIDYASKALELEPTNPEFLNLAGLICGMIGQLDSAIDHFRKAIKAEPENESFRDNFRRVILGAQPVFEDYARQEFVSYSYVNAASIDLRYGELLREIGEIPLSEVYFRRGLAATPPQAGHEPIPETAILPDQAPQNLWDLPAPQVTTVELGHEPDLQSVCLNPVYAKLQHYVAEIHLNRGELAEAEAASRRAIAIDPNLPEAFLILGNALLRQGDVHTAANAYGAAVERKQDYAEALANLGSLFMSKGQFQEGGQCYERAIAAQPENAAMCWNFGLFWEAQHKWDQALHWWQRAIALQPTFQKGSGYYKIGCALQGMGKTPEALNWFDQAIGVEPTFWSAHYDLCEILVGQHDLDRARAAVDRLWAIAQAEGNEVERLTAASLYLKVTCFIGVGHLGREVYIKNESLLYKNLNELNHNIILRLYVNLLFDVPHVRDDVAANNRLATTLARRYHWDLQAINDQHNQAKPAIFTAAGKPASQFRRRHHDPSRPLRLGFLSKHFRRHSVGWCSAHIMQELKQITPHLMFYVTGDMNRDDRTAIFEAVAEKMVWPGTPQLMDGSARSILRAVDEDDLDVLVDLDSITVLPHAEVLAKRPVPVCVTWLGYDAPHINPHNYNIVDWHTHPAGVEHYYVEKLIRMPGSFAAISGLPIVHTDRCLLRTVQRIDDSQVAYLCVATGQKVSPEMLAAQIHILRHVPNSVLFYKARVGDLNSIWQLYREECLRQGVNPRRVLFLPRTGSEEEHRATYLLADVLLDSYPYSGATHNLEALWFNLPIVTRIGEQSFSRLGYSLMRAAGVDEGATWTWEEYIDWGIRFGLDRDLRESVRAKLQRGKEPGQLQLLWNPKQFAADLYQVFQDLRSKADLET